MREKGAVGACACGQGKISEGSIPTVVTPLCEKVQEGLADL